MRMGTLQLFCDVITAKNFTQAAEWNDRTQAHASNLFLTLERHFGARLPGSSIVD